MINGSIIQIAAAISLIILIIAMLVVFYRLQKGPSLPDRIISLDLFASITIGIIAAYSIFSNEAIVLDAAIIVAVITFLGTVAVARFLERRQS